jgi:hypothetical protein
LNPSKNPRWLTSVETDAILEKGERLPSHSLADELSAWDTAGVAAISYLLLWPFAELAYRAPRSRFLEDCFLVAWPFMAVGVGVPWAKWRDYRRRDKYAAQLERRFSKVARLEVLDVMEIGAVSFSLEDDATREEVAIVGDAGEHRFVKIKRRPVRGFAPSWEALYEKELTIEELERKVGLRPEEPNFASLRDSLANSGSRLDRLAIHLPSETRRILFRVAAARADLAGSRHLKPFPSVSAVIVSLVEQNREELEGELAGEEKVSYFLGRPYSPPPSSERD